jgi:hypothetical protein
LFGTANASIILASQTRYRPFSMARANHAKAAIDGVSRIPSGSEILHVTLINLLASERRVTSKSFCTRLTFVCTYTLWKNDKHDLIHHGLLQ